LAKVVLLKKKFIIFGIDDLSCITICVVA